MTSAPLDPPVSHIDLLRAAYAAFNSRDIAGAVSLMTEDVAWPRAFKGGFVRGPQEVGAYWRDQWGEIDPTVEPLAFHEETPGRIVVEVRQVVRDLQGTLLADERVGHRFVIEGGLIRGMEVCPLG
ncbi:nuclear transport factor 2 family protein [Luteolibacter flavescens]|uniref:Nuclear transport factor 2 family protein n=1 Tax=Luteolibacter flavescens TaxID=1859460 RepID=A0ABT3FN34_9BACT|nr:nuclear transport factor 2 family protein [Luteolibacter flavescens]MCW1884979.1 nuclear transport factor 2 family protein [Luteolibacter flavescens]